MKSERRHELQHNELAEWLAKTFEAVKPYQNAILAVAMVGAVALAGWALVTRESGNRRLQAWNDLGAAIESGNPLTLSDVAENHRGSAVGDMAAVVAADLHFTEGCRLLFLNKASAFQELNKAVDGYESVIEGGRTPSLLARATYGLARAKEAKGTKTDIEQAVQLYEEVVKQWPNCEFKAAAADRAEDLKKPAIKEMYDRFANFDPKPIVSNESGAAPSFDMKSLPAETPLVSPMPSVETKAPEDMPPVSPKTPDENKPSENM